MGNFQNSSTYDSADVSFPMMTQAAQGSANSGGGKKKKKFGDDEEGESAGPGKGGFSGGQDLIGGGQGGKGMASGASLMA